MILLIHERNPIPTMVGKHCFNPYCEMDDAEGKNFLKSFPNTYREISQKDIPFLDLSKWKVLDVLQGKNLKQATEILTEAEKIEVFEFIRKLKNPKVVQPKSLDQMNVAELRHYAREHNIDIPKEAVKKLDILGVITA